MCGVGYPDFCHFGVILDTAMFLSREFLAEQSLSPFDSITMEALQMKKRFIDPRVIRIP